jgi:hypothetical protein
MSDKNQDRVDQDSQDATGESTASNTKKILDIMLRPPDDGWRRDLADPQTAAQGWSRELSGYGWHGDNAPSFENVGEEGLNLIREERLARAREWDERKKQLSMTAWTNQLQFATEQLKIHESNREELKSLLDLTALVLVPPYPSSVNHFLRPLINGWTFPKIGLDLLSLCKGLEGDSDLRELIGRVTNATTVVLDRERPHQSAVKLFAMMHELTGQVPKWSAWRQWLVATLNSENDFAVEAKEAYYSLLRSAELVARINNCSVKEAFSQLLLQSYVRYSRVWLLNAHIARVDPRWVSHPALDVVFGALGMSGDPLRMVASTEASSWKASGLRHGPWSTLSVAQQSVLTPVVDSIEPFATLHKPLMAPVNLSLSEWYESLEESPVVKDLVERVVGT